MDNLTHRTPTMKNRPDLHDLNGSQREPQAVLAMVRKQGLAGQSNHRLTNTHADEVKTKQEYRRPHRAQFFL
ncbi:hypothetical protein [Phaeobacter inhibens]|uniref:hypothetical protein n=1 Tax=Phaeobacter inhibens TaxID=221822 RepID=UPI000F4CB630|nr:hypothetical protein [Phaeobacter inhibens]